MELLKNFRFVKAQQLTPHSADVLENLKEAVEEVKQIKARTKKAQPLNEFLSEL